MKRLFPGFLVLMIAVFVWVACNKNGGFNAPSGKIAVSKLKVKINEPDTMALVNADTTKAVTWSITPSDLDTLQTQKNAARIRFTKAGKYTVKASNNGIESAPITITVTDSVFVRTPSLTPLNADEVITLTPKYVKATSTDTAYFAFTMTTKDTYCGNSVLEFGVYYDAQTQIYYMTFDGAGHAFQCTDKYSTLTAYIGFNFVHSFANGTYPLQVGMNGQLYHGSITITSTAVTFNWPYTTGIIVAPLQLSR